MKYISILPIIIYVVFVWHKFGIQKSISESYYRLTFKQKPLFFFALLSTAILMIFSVINSHPGNLLANIVIFFAGAGIGYTSAAAAFKDSKIQGTIHVYGALAGYILGYVHILITWGFDSVYFIVPSVFVMFGAYKINEYKISNGGNLKYRNPNNNYIWWFEIIGLVTIWIGIIL